jgi:hypothetical protein
MTPRQQTYQHDPANGINGDCTRTCIAALLNKQQDEVPHFLWDGCDSETFNRRQDIFLKTQGLARRIWTLPAAVDLPGVLNWIATSYVNLYVCLSGTSSLGVNHQVIVFNNEIVMDPSGNGIVGPCDDGNWYIEMYVPLFSTKEILTIEEEQWYAGQFSA